MRLQIHDKPLVEPYEYWCYKCRKLNLAFVALDTCPECNGRILKGQLYELDKEALLNATHSQDQKL